MSPTIRYSIDAENCVCSVSGSWGDFAVANGTADLSPETVVGSVLWKWIADSETEQVYRTLFDRIRATGRPFAVPFRCDAPTMRRFMRLRVSAEDDGVIHLESETVREEQRDSQKLLDPILPRNGELLKMCGWCKKIPLPDDRWLEIEDAVRELSLFESPSLPQISHAMCPACYASTMKALDDQLA